MPPLLWGGEGSRITEGLSVSQTVDGGFGSLASNRCERFPEAIGGKKRGMKQEWGKMWGNEEAGEGDSRAKIMIMK